MIYNRISDYIRKNNMIPEGYGVVAGISGGPDSTCLFHVLCKLQIPFAVVHINHGLRETAVCDEEFVEKLCREKGIFLRVVKADVRAYAAERGLSLEEAGREIRYDAFRKVLSERFNNRGVIAVAHNANDQAETVLFRMFRGTGPEGLSGMFPVSGDVIRPLLFLTRDEIESFLHENSFEYVTDETNFTDEYARNRIRNNILPDANDSISGKATEHLCDLAQMMQEANDVLCDVRNEAFLRLVTKTEDGILIRKEILLEKPYIVSAVLKEALCRVAGRKKDISSIHISALADLMTKQVGRHLDLIYNIGADRVYEGVILMSSEPSDKEKAKVTAKMSIEKVVPSEENPARAPRSNCKKWFDYDKINGPVLVRNPEKGDFIYINSDGGKKNLSDYLKDEKIPLSKRSETVVVACGSEILWVKDHRIGERCKVDKNTANILIVELEEESNE